MNHLTLNQLLPGQWAVVTELRHNADMNRRLNDLGLLIGTNIQCLHRSPWGSPAAFQVRGTTIAIRTSDSKRVVITPIAMEEHCNGNA